MTITDVQLKDRLVFISLFIAVFENFKHYLTSCPRQLLWDSMIKGSDPDGERLYREKVLANKKLSNGQEIKGEQKSMMFFHHEFKTFTEEDILLLGEMRELRNYFTHDMMIAMYSEIKPEWIDLFFKMIEFYIRVNNYWCLCRVVFKTGKFVVSKTGKSFLPIDPRIVRKYHLGRHPFFGFIEDK